MPHLVLSRATALARLVSWTTDRGSIQELLLFPPHPSFLCLGPVQPQLALMRQDRVGALKSTGNELGEHFNAQSIFSVWE